MPTFILGAGFNADAAGEAGPLFAESLYDGHYQVDCGYPLVGDTIRLSFVLEVIPDGKSVEQLFSDALARGDYDPIKKLAERVNYADFRIANALASGERENVYQQFFRTFADSNFVTFNYDSLPETFLIRLRRWYPHDGYGVRVAVAPMLPSEEAPPDTTSSTLVLHLHGSLCIRTDDTRIDRTPGHAMAMLSLRDEPLYIFDPHSISGNFAPWGRYPGSVDLKDRIIAPILDKSQGLKQKFICDTYSRAEAMVRDSDIVVAVGYSFNLHDRASYQRLLHAQGESTGRRLLVVSPDAAIVANAIRPDFPNLSIQAQVATFKQWVDASFPGLGNHAETRGRTGRKPPPRDLTRSRAAPLVQHGAP